MGAFVSLWIACYVLDFFLVEGMLNTREDFIYTVGSWVGVRKRVLYGYDLAISLFIIWDLRDRNTLEC